MTTDKRLESCDLCSHNWKSFDYIAQTLIFYEVYTFNFEVHPYTSYLDLTVNICHFLIH